MIHLITTKKSWIEGTAVQQLEKVNALEGVQNVVGLPDLHAGPVGIAMSSRNIIYPHLVGNDVGCGMGFWQTDSPVRKMKLDRWVKRLTDIESPYEDDLSELAQRFDLSSQRWFSALGTIGLGNHFAELQRVEKIHNSELFTSCGLDKEKLFLLVHSGSRGLGASIMDSHIRENGSVGLTVDSEAGETYLERHDYAVKWGKANRELISQRFLGALNMNGTPVLDLTHNSVTPESFGNETLWVHRKGANPSNQGVAIIAGSRGTLSYLVKPIGDLASTNFSLAHGAGRKWKRSEMAGRLKAKHQLSELTQTPLGGRVICEDRALLFEEAPEAYKNIHQVITDLETHGLIEVIASFRPLLTYKTRERR